MSSAERAASFLSGLDARELRILQGIELGMTQHEFVPIEVVAHYAGLMKEEIEFWIDDLDKKDLLLRRLGTYSGYILNYNSYDLLALNAFVKSKVLEALGMPLGVGKEADIFEALDPKELKVAIKFHRLGRVSFRDTRRKRDFIADKRHVSWLYQSRLAAEKEYKALEIAKEAGVSVPRPISQNRHAIVMERIYGIDLSKVITLENPLNLFCKILDNVKLAYKSGVIHGDLSEFNIFLLEGENPVFIDWPQYISTSHYNAEIVLKRDIGNIIHFFERKFGLKKRVDDIVNWVKN